MEPDRYQQNSKLFIIGIICLLVSLSLFAFSFYILPYLLWDWGYEVPDFVFLWREWLKEEYHFTEAGAVSLIFLMFIVPALICGYISYWASNRIDNEIYGIVPEKTQATEEEKEDLRETFGFSLKIILLIILVLVAVSLVEWLVAIPPPTQ